MEKEFNDVTAWQFKRDQRDTWNPLGLTTDNHWMVTNNYIKLNTIYYLQRK